MRHSGMVDHDQNAVKSQIWIVWRGMLTTLVFMSLVDTCQRVQIASDQQVRSRSARSPICSC